MSETRYQKVLLIDDNEIDNFVNQKIVKKTKFTSEVEICDSGQEALKHLQEQAQQPDQLPEIIFLDIMMPVMDGFEFLERYKDLPKAVHSKCRIIMLSSSESFKDLNRANSSPYVSKFLNKPLTEAVLAAINV